uniref:Putative tho complex subunit n=1 Tax=Ixodes ricinus TaxID=34613 RepID=A0A0K8R2Z0_IXORI
MTSKICCPFPPAEERNKKSASQHHMFFFFSSFSVSSLSFSCHDVHTEDSSAFLIWHVSDPSVFCSSADLRVSRMFFF